jgi:hypothetical protein
VLNACCKLSKARTEVDDAAACSKVERCELIVHEAAVSAACRETLHPSVAGSAEQIVPPESLRINLWSRPPAPLGGARSLEICQVGEMRFNDFAERKPACLRTDELKCFERFDAGAEFVTGRDFYKSAVGNFS